MKLALATVSFLAAHVATAAVSQAAQCAIKPITWESVSDKPSYYYWKLYSAPAGTDLRGVKPKYHRCTVTTPSNAEDTFKRTFEGNKMFEFQPLDTESIGVNCIECTPQMLGNYYETKISNYITCSMYDDLPIR